MAMSLIALVYIVGSCSSSSDYRVKDTPGSVERDSVADDDAAYLDSLRLDSLRMDSIRLDSIRNDSLYKFVVTPDLALFNVHGKVKQIKYDKDFILPLGEGLEGAVEFDEEGNWKNITSARILKGDGGKITRVDRNAEGYITSIFYTDGQETYEYKIKWQDGKPMSMDMKGYEWSGLKTFKYNEDFVEESETSDRAFGQSSKILSKYSDFRLDENGNWVECRVFTEGNTNDALSNARGRVENGKFLRTISYYTKPGSLQDSVIHVTSDSVYVVKR